MIDSTYALVRLYLPKGQWAYLGWLMSQGFDLDRFTKACDRRRRALTDREISLADFVMMATDRLHQLQYRYHAERTNLAQPVFRHQLIEAIRKTEDYFLHSGTSPMRWCGWRA
ncbi:MAG: hypothetical protein AAFR17_17000 [Pseudomonadota bacterium]